MIFVVLFKFLYLSLVEALKNFFSLLAFKHLITCFTSLRVRDGGSVSIFHHLLMLVVFGGQEVKLRLNELLGCAVLIIHFS
jgi:hypothetical protein